VLRDRVRDDRAVLFTASAHAGLADGSITVTFRAWRRPQVKVGGVYRAGPVDLTVDALRRVRASEITPADARRAGFADRAALLRYLGVDDDAELSRVDFHCAPARERPRPSPDLTDEDAAELRRRLDRLDRAKGESWTREVLALIAARPGVVSTELAAHVGRDRAQFKEDVRKLKRLGLTESLEVGYRLSPRGAALLDRLAGG
jgi:hypothetical protein